jgi:hypothetical protein
MTCSSDILVTPLDQFNDKPGKDPKWEDKTNPKLAWVGAFCHCYQAPLTL